MSLGAVASTFDPSRLLSLIREDDDEGLYTWCKWDQVSGAALAAARSGESIHFHDVDRDWWTLLTILSKIEWMKSLHTRGEIEDVRWMYYAATEVDFFHVRFRSLLDHVGPLLARCALHPDSVPKNFFRLKALVAEPTKRSRFGPRGRLLHELFKEASWAEDVRSVRNDLLHHGTDTLVFPDDCDILFQIHRRQQRLVLLEKVMHNDNVVDFRKYAALTLGLLVLWRERVATVLEEALGLEHEWQGEGANRHAGLAQLRDWTRLLT